VRAHLVLAFALATAMGGCGSAERKAAEAKADSLQRVLQHEQDSLKGVREKATVQAAQAAVTKRREDSLKAAREQAVADSIMAERSRPRDLVLMNVSGASVAPHDWMNDAFVLDSAADCTVHGHIDVQPDPATKSDVEVFLFTADDYSNWKSNSRAQVTPIFHATPRTATTLNTGVPQAGEYHLVVSNRFSVIARKTVKGQVTVTCRGLQPRQP